MIDFDTFGHALMNLWPHGDAKVPGLRAGIIKTAPSVFAKYGIDTPTVLAQMFAQFSEECGCGTEMVEDLNYRAAALTAQWPSHFTTAQAIEMQHNPQAIANQAYNGRMGNRPGSNDGWTFRGRGLSQCTGRDGYGELAKRLVIDILSHPDDVNDPTLALMCGVADFVACGCLPYARNGDIMMVTRRLNGGYIGLNERKHQLDLWTHSLGL